MPQVKFKVKATDEVEVKFDITPEQEKALRNGAYPQDIIDDYEEIIQYEYTRHGGFELDESAPIFEEPETTMEIVKKEINEKVYLEDEWVGKLQLEDSERVLRNYFKNAGIKMDGDTKTEIDGIIQDVCAAAMAGAVEIMLGHFENKEM